MSQNPFARATFLLSCARIEQLPDDTLPEIAFAGRSNAGKSSALNTLCGLRALARVSKTPGRTQLINLFEVPGGRFVDLPGYGYAQVPGQVRRDWGKLIEQYMQVRQTLAGVVLIMDIRHPLTDFDTQMLDWAKARHMPIHALLTKADKLGYGASKNTLLSVQKALADREQPACSVALFSATARTGLEPAREQLMAWLGIEATGQPRADVDSAPEPESD
ncbi:MAG: ribosome biogenesis GTP-binding protein YihA/YsxC [Polycyclovorans sp.]|jgi:GTP-binding protein|nr:ribosome biogenesis GTP-binding protein YihA/YsxC [Gammaproteobacteria bacterium]MDP1544157.1 ribosome biogenesis GTP-binding protein YihA/YsxC [Polycyclovorans sp.]MEC8849615.1 ribosome biogenesis GTP-binding protein YihA/YsxC [Pseudomonadota bacterium]|tara:strand:+ start:6507 stop:7163 length:657 start_codon:yes stop_codon:yes gene_type:complete